MRLLPPVLAVLAALALGACTFETRPSPGTAPSPGVGVPPGPGAGGGIRPGGGTGGTPGTIVPPSPGTPGTGVPPAPGTPTTDLPGTGVPPGPGADACGASGVQHLVGRNVSAIRNMAFRGPVRILRPGDAMTMEFAPRRINFIVTAAGTIEEITCG
ncbi:MAG: hypothetical protein KJZ85_05715 [Rhodobacteraceae bacterium]|jgi:hypothetical protein|nr:hypothetical protein [Paracoccaceae bacterium]